MNGAELLGRTLSQAGVRTIFSLSGNQIMPVYDACIDADIRIVHVRHEAAAVYMADAWAQLTGGIGVALLTAGPGFANGLSPLFSARQAESPVLLLSGDSPVGQDGAGAFQEMTQTDMVRPLVKRTGRVNDVERLSGDIATSVRAALAGRPGPVHLALPFDVLNAEEPFGADCPPESLMPDRQALSTEPAARIGEAIAGAKRPVILLGPRSNRSRARDPIAALERATGAPVIAMESPRGLRDPALGAFAGMLARADLIVSLGKRFDFTLGFGRPPALAADAGIIVVDPEPAMAEHAHDLFGDRLKLCEVADTDGAMQKIAETAPSLASTGGHETWRAEIADAIALRPPAPEARRGIHPQPLCEAVDAFLASADDPILICDGGEFGQWAQAFCTAPTRIINGPSGAIGGGLCYAIAAKLARPEATVAVLMGDGTAGFQFAEFETAVRENAPFTVVIGNDDCWNAEHQIQLREYGPDRLVGCRLSPDARYDLAASGFGCHGEHVTGIAELQPALLRAAASGLPACLNVALEGAAAPAAPSLDAAVGS